MYTPTFEGKNLSLASDTNRNSSFRRNVTVSFITKIRKQAKALKLFIFACIKYERRLETLIGPLKRKINMPFGSYTMALLGRPHYFELCSHDENDHHLNISPNFHTASTEGNGSRTDLACVRLCPWLIVSGIDVRTCTPTVSKQRLCR
ncbi:hypothetical protein AVEN_107026-1 [Araneus ventricosus]|uniref:Uncharacterized protein n=1 Tax=Araneus ventricosus TaxID=182803 RepID=A0A4Y2W6C9_ARAVE|nr:hypothetical protein AVEN_107026-1 [Araneus ventricosus]